MGTLHYRAVPIDSGEHAATALYAVTGATALRKSATPRVGRAATV